MKSIPAFLCVLALLTPTLGRAQYLKGQSASTVLGQTNFTGSFAAVPPSATSLGAPAGIAIDATTGVVFVSDANNSRILRYPSANALKTGGAATGVLGQPDFATLTVNTTQSGLRSPTGIFLDANGTLWVADSGNNRVVWYANALNLANGANATGVLGQTNFTNMGTSNAATGMSAPSALVVDVNGTLWIADSGNHRVLRFISAASLSSGAAASRELGQTNFGMAVASSGTSGLNGPSGVATYLDSLLFVADSGNNRLVAYDISTTVTNGMAATKFLGTPDSSTTTSGTSATRVFSPSGLLVDSRGTLYVADRANNRVLEFFKASTKATGAAANSVLGASTFTDSFPSTTAAKFDNPVAIAINAKDQLFVADRQNNRVLRFAPVSVPSLRASAGSVKIKRHRKATVAYTLTNTNYPGAYRLTFPASNHNFTVSASFASGGVTPVLPVGGSTAVVVTFTGRKAAKRPIAFTVTARATAVPYRGAAATTSVAVK